MARAWSAISKDMDVQLAWSIQCIGTKHPLLWFSIAAASSINWFLGRLAARSWRTRRGFDWHALYTIPITVAGVLVAAFGATIILDAMHFLTYNGLACVHFVRWWLFLPLVAALLSFLWSFRPTTESWPQRPSSEAHEDS